MQFNKASNKHLVSTAVYVVDTSNTCFQPRVDVKHQHSRNNKFTTTAFMHTYEGLSKTIESEGVTG